VSSTQARTQQLEKFMTPGKPIPTLASWLGGTDRLDALTKRFYEKVPTDPILAPVFAGMNPLHAQLVAAFVAEVFSGGTPYTDHGGSHAHMIGKHMGRRLTETQRKRWVGLMLETADEIGLPDDPEFRAALVGYFEWGTRLAVLNSQDGTAAPDPSMPMPKWGWGPPGGPYQLD
jgi:hemoglobin